MYAATYQAIARAENHQSAMIDVIYTDEKEADY